jgi:hypothetical protein
MYLLLLAFGGALTAAGIALAAFGVSIHDHTFDTSIVTPGVVATVGGLLLVGLGLALRVLQRIERALALRSMQRAEPALLPQAERAVLPHPPIQAPNPQPTSVAPASPEKPPEVTAEKSPLIARLEATRVIAEMEASRSPDPVSDQCRHCRRAGRQGASREAKKWGGSASDGVAARCRPAPAASNRAAGGPILRLGLADDTAAGVRGASADSPTAGDRRGRAKV